MMTIGDLIRDALIEKEEVLTNEKCTVAVEFVEFAMGQELYSIRNRENAEMRSTTDFSEVVRVLTE